MTLLLLYLLALLDGLLCGGRVSMGRCALIHKRAYYARALVRGLLGAQVISTIALAALLLVNRFSANQTVFVTDLEDAAERMLWVFVPYAVAVVGSLALRMIPSTDLRSATSVVALGPLTAMRPLLMVAGVLYGICGSQLLETRVLGLFILGLMLSLEYFLNRAAAARQRREIREVV
jgi:hypothetical protein